MVKSLIIIALSITVIVLTIVILRLILNSPKAKGKQGERQVAKYLNKLPSKAYTVFNNVLLQNNIHSTQIDHIVFSQYGIFVIETKNYSGIIRGKDNSENWTKEIYGSKFVFRNPILQNNAHVQALKHILSIHDDRKIIPIVAFSNRAKLKVHTVNKVVYYNKVNKIIMRYRKKIFYKSEISRFVKRIDSIAVTTTPKAMKDHIKRIQERQIINQERAHGDICPKCGSSLIEKKGQLGKILVCSNYPYCRFKTSLKNYKNNKRKKKKNLHNGKY